MAGLLSVGVGAQAGCATTSAPERGGVVPVDSTRDPRTLLDCPRGTTVTQGLTMGVLSTVYCERPTGVRHGPFLEWWPNKVKKTAGNYKEGQRDGAWSFFTQTGELESQVTYQGDQPVSAPTPTPANPANPAASPAPPR